MKRVRDIIEGQRLISTNAKTTVLEVARKMSEHNIGAVPVLDGTKLVGIFSERDLMSRVVSKGRVPSETSIAEVMTPEVGAAAPDDSLNECIEKMQSKGYRHLPVVEGEKVLGMLSLRDLLQVDRIDGKRERKLLTELVKEEPIYDV